MAGAAMKDIKLRIRSVESTRQITSAMQLVAGSKLRRARLRMESTRPYMTAAQEVISSIAAHKDVQSAFFKAGSGRPCAVVIAGDRGLAGHYNAAVFKIADELLAAGAAILPVGKKAIDRYTHRGADIVTADYVKVEHVTPADCRAMASRLIEGFLSGEFGQVTVISTTFVTAMTQDPVTGTLLPVSPELAPQTKSRSQLLMEPGANEILKAVMPDYLAGVLYGKVSDAIACEMSARRNAMDSATKNADQMISDLSLRYNRARQGSITQEITEIVAGAEK